MLYIFIKWLIHFWNAAFKIIQPGERRMEKQKWFLMTAFFITATLYLLVSQAMAWGCATEPDVSGSAVLDGNDF